MSARLQAELAAFLLSPEPSARPSLLSGAAAARFRVYRNNFHHGLGRQLAEAYPVVRRLVGADFFQAAASGYVCAEPPRSRSLALYGAGFPAFLERFAPAAALPYLADVARLERARLEALHAADASPLPPRGLKALAGDDARPQRHPASRLVTSRHPVFDIWTANRADAEPGPRRLAAVGQSVLVTRPSLRLRMLPLTPAEAAFARHALDGVPLRAAHERSVSEAGDFDLAALLSTLLVAGAFRAPGAAAATTTDPTDGNPEP